MHDLGPRLRNKLLLRLVAPLTFLIFLSSLDRVNVSFAALQMNQALGLSPERYGFGVSLFFVGYLLFQFPHTALLRRIGARRWIFAAVLSWGLVATCAAFVQGASDFFALRVLLGVAEAGFAPGVVYIMSQWMPLRFRASAIAGTMLAIPISVICGGPLSGWLMTLPLGYPGWRFMFFVEGALTVLVALLTPLYFVDTPARARWLDADEKAWLTAELARERREASAAATRRVSASWPSLLTSVSVWSAAMVWFALMAGAYGIIFWLPQLLKQLSGRSDFQVGVLSALPWLGLGLGMMVNAWHSDRKQERYLHIGVPALVCAAALALGVSVEPGPLALSLLVIGGLGLGAGQGAYWALPTSFLPEEMSGRGITLINLLGSSAGLLVPPLIGWIRTRTGAFALPVYLLAATLIAGVVALVVLHRHQARSERGRPLEHAPRLHELPR